MGVWHVTFDVDAEVKIPAGARVEVAVVGSGLEGRGIGRWIGCWIARGIARGMIVRWTGR